MACKYFDCLTSQSAGDSLALNRLALARNGCGLQVYNRTSTVSQLWPAKHCHLTAEFLSHWSRQAISMADGGLTTGSTGRQDGVEFGKTRLKLGVRAAVLATMT